MAGSIPSAQVWRRSSDKAVAQRQEGGSVAGGKACRILQAEKGLPGQGVKISQVRQLGLGRLV